MNPYGKAAQAYANVGLETNVADASPHELIAMLFDGAIKFSNEALLHLEQQRVAAKGTAISKAIRIIDEGLKGGLNVELGGELAQQLRELYDYMVLRLLQANLHNKAEAIREVINLLSDIRSAWVEMGRIQQAKPTEATMSVGVAA